MSSTTLPKKVNIKTRFFAIKIVKLNETEKQSLVELAFSVLQEQHKPGAVLQSPVRRVIICVCA